MPGHVVCMWRNMDFPKRSDRLFPWAALAAWTLCLPLILGELAHAQDRAFQSHESIRMAATEHARAQAGAGRISASARLPDSRLHLQQCDQPLQTSGVSQALHAQIQVSCPGQWKIYVPVTLQREQQLVVARRSLQVGEIVAEADLALEWRALQGRGYGQFENLDAVVGRRVARPLRAGQVIQPNQLRQAMSIRKGDIVTLISRAGPVEIRGRGRAHEDAVENGRLRVENLSSGRIVEGYARGDGIVEIQG